MNQYVVGFVMTPDRQAVLLIKKERPEWQKGRYNGVGGKIEPDETPVGAMARECREESGLEVPIEEWLHFLTATADDHICYFYVAQHPAIKDYQNMTDEYLQPFLISTLSRVPTIPNLQWLIPLARLAGRDDNFGRRMMLPIEITEVRAHE